MMLKKSLLPLFLSAEVIIFILYYCCGPQGVRSLYYLQQDNRVLEQSIEQLHKTIKNLEQEKQDFLKYPFYREQIAREQLQMMKPGEEIYLYEKNL